MDIGVRLNEPRLLGRVEQHLPFGWKPIRRPAVDHLFSLIAAGEGRGAGGRPKLRRFNVLYKNALQVARTHDLDELFETFESELRRLVAEFAKGRVFVHAGVVAWRGRAVVIPGRSFSGKSSLVAELVRAGATYYSDEFAVLDARGRVHPFVKPLSLREGKDGRQTDYAVEALGGTAGTKPIPVGCVLVTEYRPGARWMPRPLSHGNAVLALLAHTVAARRDPAIVLPTLRRAAADAAALKSKRGEAADVAARILATAEG